jgi:hypothetical protein
MFNHKNKAMTRKLSLTITVLTVLSFIFACEKLDVNEEFYLEYQVTVSQTGAAFDQTDVLDISSESSLINQYKDKIKNIEILEATYLLTYFVGPADQQINTATLTVADETGQGVEEIATVTNVNLQSLLNSEHNLTVNAPGIDRLAQLVKDSPNKVQLHLYGTANTGPLAFTIKFRFKVKMTANPL